MKDSAIFTRKRMGFDNGVWLTMFCFIFVSLALVGYKLIRKEEVKACASMNIFVNGRSDIDNFFFTAGEPLRFRASISPGDEITWDFGDNSKKDTGFSTVHVFRQEATYMIRAVVNGLCMYEKKVTIRRPLQEARDSTGVVTGVIGPDEAKTGDPVTFSTVMPATIYQWYIENNGSYPKQMGKQVSYTFKRQGTYIIVLVLDDKKEKKYTRLITIVQKESGPEVPVVPTILIPKKKDTVVTASPKADTATHVEEPPVIRRTYRAVSNEIFKNYLQALVCGERKEKDFDDYLCEGGNTAVIENGRQRKTFSEFAKEVAGKKIEIESVEAVRDNANCAVTLKVKFEKKSIIARSPCK